MVIVSGKRKLMGSAEYFTGEVNPPTRYVGTEVDELGFKENIQQYVRRKIGLTNDTDAGSTDDAYERYFSGGSVVPSYSQFTATGRRGIPGLVSLFACGLFDPINTTGNFRRSTRKRDPNEMELRHIADYLGAPEMSVRLSEQRETVDVRLSPLGKLLRGESTNTDAVVHAIFSYSAQFSKIGLSGLQNLSNIRANAYAVESFLHAMDDSCADYVYEANENVIVTTNVSEEKLMVPVWDAPHPRPFVRCAFRLLRRFATHYAFLELGNDVRKETPVFDLITRLDRRFVEHLRSVSAKVSRNRLNVEDLDRVESELRKYDPFRDDMIVQELSLVYEDRPMRVVTGQACCGKTTLLSRLERNGWVVLSRADIGTYSGKSKDPSTIATLHAAMETMLRRNNVIGDRGPIDNPLWSIIMPLCDPRYKMQVVDCLLEWFSETFNEASIAYMRSQRTVIFLDPHFDQNMKRMSERCESGDSQRCRLTEYNHVQFMAYYVSALMFNWPIVLVPYQYVDGRLKLSPKGYDAIEKFVLRYFGTKPKGDRSHEGVNIKRLNKCGDRNNKVMFSEYDSPANEYPKSVAIFK